LWILKLPFPVLLSPPEIHVKFKLTFNQCENGKELCVMEQIYNERVAMRVRILLEIAHRGVKRNGIIDMSWFTDSLVRESHETIDLFFDAFYSMERQGLIESDPPHFRLSATGERFLNS
jgi:hypothetical protein